MEKRKLDRRAFSYYMRVLDARTEKLVGHLVDISIDGFKVDSPTSVPLNVDFLLRMDIPTGDSHDECPGNDKQSENDAGFDGGVHE